MKARFLAVNLHEEVALPAMPSLLLQVEDNILLYSQGWTQEVRKGCLEDLTEGDVYALLPIRASERICLSNILELPSDDLMAPETLAWVRERWIDFRNGVLQKQPLLAMAAA